MVNKPERRRVDAENEAVRSREKVRTLMENRAVEQAMEEDRASVPVHPVHSVGLFSLLVDVTPCFLNAIAHLCAARSRSWPAITVRHDAYLGQGTIG